MSQTQERIPVRSVVVFDGGRVTIPKSARNRFTGHTDEPLIGQRRFELLDPSDGDDIFEAEVNHRGYIYIPARFRDRYGIEDGDYVDLDLLVGGGK